MSLVYTTLRVYCFVVVLFWALVVYVTATLFSQARSSKGRRSPPRGSSLTDFSSADKLGPSALLNTSIYKLNPTILSDTLKPRAVVIIQLSGIVTTSTWLFNFYLSGISGNLNDCLGAMLLSFVSLEKHKSTTSFISRKCNLRKTS